jgi:hypothetical protein
MPLVLATHPIAVDYAIGAVLAVGSIAQGVRLLRIVKRERREARSVAT